MNTHTKAVDANGRRVKKTEKELEAAR